MCTNATVKMSNNTAFLGIGGNKGNRLELLVRCKELIDSQGITILSQSAIYETPPWGFASEQNFYNQVLQVSTNESPNQLFEILQIIENKLGRTRHGEAYESRTMDIDILFFNDLIINKGNLELPHARLHLRKFVLIPLYEIAPQWVHPVFNLTIAELLEQCNDPSECAKVDY